MKVLLRSIGALIASFLILLVLVLIQHVDPRLEEPRKIAYDFPDTLSQELSIDSLMEIAGNNKVLPPGYERAALLALSAYPDLKDAHIEMILTQSGAPMESNFRIGTLFGPGKSRIYQILLNDATNTGFDEILLRSLPFDAQVGILAHELGHVEYYRQLNTLQIGKWGLQYLFDDSFRAAHERHTDLLVVYHGLGSQIWQYAWYLRHDPSCARLYARGKGFLDTYYMTDKEIMSAIVEEGL